MNTPVFYKILTLIWPILITCNALTNNILAEKQVRYGTVSGWQMRRKLLTCVSFRQANNWHARLVTQWIADLCVYFVCKPLFDY